MIYSGNEIADRFRYQKSREFDIKMANDGYENPFWRDQELFRRMNKTNNGAKKFRLKAHLENREEIKSVLVPGRKYISKEKFTLMRNEYIAKAVLEEFGWEEVQWDLKAGQLRQLEAQLLKERTKEKNNDVNGTGEYEPQC